jgi:hypothetical protein
MRIRYPTDHYAAEIGGKGQQREHKYASHNAREGQKLVGIYAGSFDGIDLLGYLHRP